MNLSRCDKGHFYDKEKYATCPHCVGGSASDESLTTVFTEDVTAPVAPEVPKVMPVAQTLAPSQAGQFASGTSLPIANMSADQATVAMDFANLDTPTVPLQQEVPNPFSIPNNLPAIENVDDEDDHTVGFFDDDFFATPTTSVASPSTGAPTASAPVANKLTTPCVGWLIALGGEHIGTDFRLKVGKNFIGRNPQMDIALTEDKSVSRERHAIVVYEPKAHLYLVQPGESSSLVYRNNEVVLSPVKLEAYDMITVGEVNLLFMPLCGERFNWSDLLEEMKKSR